MGGRPTHKNPFKMKLYCFIARPKTIDKANVLVTLEIPKQKSK